ncbi:MAG: type transport system ATP-binding protein [Solirubrobacteraceae bacterium]|nr:type transport system ATP-binding protein [Solirubrobacteraceae bacterium]
MRLRGALLALVLLCASASAAGPGSAIAGAAKYTKTTYAVAVTQPDEYGNAVGIDTDVYLPQAKRPSAGYPLLEIFHGGGSSKDNGFDASHAARFAERGWVVILYSQRGHGASGGQTTVAGPKEMRDLFDVTAWALGVGGRGDPPHPSFGIDHSFIALAGYSQGGLNTNVAQVSSGDPAVNPYGVRFRALEPGNTPERVFDALVPNQVVKLSFGVGLLETYAVGANAHVAPIVGKWIATAAADQPGLDGGDVCDAGVHDVVGSTMKSDLAWRSVGCFADRMGLPWHWAQALDDALFPPEMAISMWQRAPGHAAHRLYLSTGGHGAPSADPSVEEDKLQVQLAFLDAVAHGKQPPGPPIVYWTRDPGVAVPSDAFRWPKSAWYRQTADHWPPAGVISTLYRLGADGRAVTGSATAGAFPLAPFTSDEANDPVAQTAASSAPLGTSPVTSLPATSSPGLVAGFRTDPLATDQELSGSSVASLMWTPASPDTQLVLKLYDQAPDGAVTLLTRGVLGLRGMTPGVPGSFSFTTSAFSARLRKAHRVLAWVMDGDAGFYKPYPGSLGGTLQAGDVSTLTLPLRHRLSSSTKTVKRKPRARRRRQPRRR